MVCLLEATIQVRRLLIGRYVFNGMVVKTCDSEELDENLSEIFTISTANSIDPLTSSMQSLSLSSPRFYEVTKETRVMVKSQTTAAKPFSIAGLEKEIEELEKFTVNSILNRHLLRDMKASPPRGIILYGFTGTGKTSVMSAFVNKHHGTSMSCYSVNSASLIGKNFEATEKKINEIITLTAETAPSIIFFDRIEVIASGRTKNQTNEEKRLIHCLMSHLEILHTHSPEKMVILVGITNSVEDIDSSLRGPNRFSIEIEFPIPLAKHREVILKNHLSNISHSIPESESSCLASTAFSFTGADLSLVVSRAAVNATNVGRNEVTTEDLRRAFASTKPSAMKEISLEVPCVKWSSIGGVSAIKSRLEQIVLWPFKHSSYLETMGISGHKGVLLYGPPGCSKTMIGKALATESKINFISIKGPEVFNKYVGESEKAVRDLFKKARQASPSIIFFDEIDALTMERGDSSHNVVSDRVLATLLTELDGVEGRDQVMIVAATNRPDKIDPAIKRPGRLDCQIYVSLPDNEARKEIFEIRMEKMPVDLDVDTEELSKRTEGYSGAEVTAVCTEAALNVIQRSLDENVPAAQSRVKMIDFEAALKTVKPRTDRKTIEFFEKYTERN
jgi:AAA family ATPase